MFSRILRYFSHKKNHLSNIQGGLIVSHAAPSFNELSERSHAFNTNTLRTSIEEETERVRGKGKGYNPDVDPYQHWLLQSTNTNPYSSRFREQLLKGSNLLRSHTEDRIYKIIGDGWDYEPAQPQLKEWDADLMMSFIDAMSKALVCGSSYMTRWSDGDYRVFTQNDVFKPVYLNQDHKQEEIYFLYPSIVNTVSRIGNKPFNPVPLGFLTQYSKDKSSPSRMGYQSKYSEMSDMIFRDCVLIQPIQSIHNIFGDSKLQIECDTATQKIYLRSYEFAFLHKGGVNKTLAIPDNVSKSVKDAVVLDAQRGLWSRGLSIYTKSNRDISEQVMVDVQQIPPLFFDQISSLVSEDAQLSKQTIEGSAQSGAMGGIAPKVNQEEDTKTQISSLFILEKAIRDVNDVFFNTSSYREEIDPISKKKIRIANYRVKFNNTITMSPEEFLATQDQPAHTQEQLLDEKMTRNSKGSNTTEGEGTPKANSWSNDMHSWGMGIEAVAHSVSSKYVIYEGNLFQAGPYFYPEQSRYDIFTSRDIEEMAHNPVNRAPLEVSHSHNAVKVGLSGGVGYLEVIGYNKRSKKDKTRFYIKKEEDTRLREAGIIKNDKFKVSPYFHRTIDSNTGLKKMYILNAALIDPKVESPRGELTGLDTSARKV